MGKSSEETSKCYNITGYYCGFYSRKSFESYSYRFSRLYIEPVFSRIGGLGRPLEISSGLTMEVSRYLGAQGTDLFWKGSPS